MNPPTFFPLTGPRLLAVLLIAVLGLLAAPGSLRAADPAGVAITVDQCKKFVDAGEGILLDARSEKAFERSHIPGAINLPVKSFNESFPPLQTQLAKAKRIVVYCSSVSCPDSEKLQKKLQQAGYPKVDVFKGGLAEWWKSGLPVTKGPPQN